MGLKSVFEAAAQTIFTVAGDTLTTGTYRSISQTYDPATGSNTDTTTTQALSGHMENYRAWEIDNMAVHHTDVRLLFPCADLVSITPKIGDQFSANGVDWNVVSVQNEDGCNVVWTLQLRKP
jgi:hypothetical protein